MTPTAYVVAWVLIGERDIAYWDYNGETLGNE